MHEIVTLQLGQRANYLATHYWNLQVFDLMSWLFFGIVIRDSDDIYSDMSDIGIIFHVQRK